MRYLTQTWLIIALAIAMLSLHSCDTTIATEIYDPLDSKITTLEVTNTSSDTVTAYLTLNGGTNYISNVNGIFGITSKKLSQGSFKIPPSDTLKYTPSVGSILSGNISFKSPPLNCPVGITLYEFTLNNSSVGNMAQETIDISCVAGVSSIGSIAVFGGGEWTDNYHNYSIKKIENKTLYQNTNLSGVFPYGCTNCTYISNPPNCADHNKYANPSKGNMCNVQRNAKHSGGTICISYIK